MSNQHERYQEKCVQNMRFEVILSENAQERYDKILYYISFKLKNEQALFAVMDDFDKAIEQLENSADVFAFCRSDRLRNLGFRKLFFDSHEYLFVYRLVDDKTVIVEGMYHELEDYENSI